MSVVRRAAEAVITLCDCAEHNAGQVTVSLDLNADRGLKVQNLDGLARVRQQHDRPLRCGAGRSKTLG
ncbi:hypothetical protein AB0M12_24115 [Nocardia vinacea]|uniref:hypothetical protein n=1 Tax=Nocardia vinacea TaxID=96468 RepID=UPI003412B8C0